MHRLQRAPHYNGRLVRVVSRCEDGRLETVRPGSRTKLAVRPENLRGLLDSYDGRAAGDEVAFADADRELLGRDYGRAREKTCMSRFL